MDEARLREVKSWLAKSQRDLKAARRLMAGDEPLSDTAVYHCQQAAEKAIAEAFVRFVLRRMPEEARP